MLKQLLSGWGGLIVPLSNEALVLSDSADIYGPSVTFGDEGTD